MKICMHEICTDCLTINVEATFLSLEGYPECYGENCTSSGIFVQILVGKILVSIFPSITGNH